MFWLPSRLSEFCCYSQRPGFCPLMSKSVYSDFLCFCFFFQETISQVPIGVIPLGKNNHFATAIFGQKPCEVRCVTKKRFARMCVCMRRACVCACFIFVSIIQRECSTRKELSGTHWTDQQIGGLFKVLSVYFCAHESYLCVRLLSITAYWLWCSVSVHHHQADMWSSTRHCSRSDETIRRHGVAFKGTHLLKNGPNCLCLEGWALRHHYRAKT